MKGKKQFCPYCHKHFVLFRSRRAAEEERPELGNPILYYSKVLDRYYYRDGDSE